ncbi:hypothetical protein B0O80DRAFT_142460 [Mortierella sp. GBAus27b]|nr:hypothetical protein B0O80DRAFT_142460 [Mortierella sp. GBAus27b]
MTLLYNTKPSPFGNRDLSESFWCREAWPILKGLLADVDDITMIDGEKSGLESGKRRNTGRKVDMESQTPRKQIGRKLDPQASEIGLRRLETRGIRTYISSISNANERHGARNRFPTSKPDNARRSSCHRPKETSRSMSESTEASPPVRSQKPDAGICPRRLDEIMVDDSRTSTRSQYHPEQWKNLLSVLECLSVRMCTCFQTAASRGRTIKT